MFVAFESRLSRLCCYSMQKVAFSVRFHCRSIASFWGAAFLRFVV